MKSGVFAVCCLLLHTKSYHFQKKFLSACFIGGRAKFKVFFLSGHQYKPFLTGGVAFPTGASVSNLEFTCPSKKLGAKREVKFTHTHCQREHDEGC